VVGDLDSALRVAEATGDEEVFVIGGAEIIGWRFRGPIGCM